MFSLKEFIVEIVSKEDVSISLVVFAKVPCQCLSSDRSALGCLGTLQQAGLGGSHCSSLCLGFCTLLAGLPSVQCYEIAAFEILSRSGGKEQSQGFTFVHVKYTECYGSDPPI